MHACLPWLRAFATLIAPMAAIMCTQACGPSLMQEHVHLKLACPSICQGLVQLVARWLKGKPCSPGVAPVTGTIHQAEAVQGSHSLHLTISVCQRKTLADLLEIALPRALALAAEECTFMRETLSANALNYLVREPNAFTYPLCIGTY